MLRFAAVGLDHGHIFGHVRGLIAAGCELVGYCPETSLPELVARFRETWPDAPALDRDAVFADPSIDVICIAAIPRDRHVARAVGVPIRSAVTAMATFELARGGRRSCLRTLQRGHAMPTIGVRRNIGEIDFARQQAVGPAYGARPTRNGACRRPTLDAEHAAFRLGYAAIAARSCGRIQPAGSRDHRLARAPRRRCHSSQSSPYCLTLRS